MSSTPQPPTTGSKILETMSVSLPLLGLDQHPSSTVMFHERIDQDTTRHADEPIVQQEDRFLYFNYNDFNAANDFFSGTDWVHNVANHDQQGYVQLDLHPDQQQQGLFQNPLAIGDEYSSSTPSQSYGTVDYLPVEQFLSVSQSQSGPLPPFQMHTPHSTLMALATPPFTSPLPPGSTTHLLCSESAFYPPNYLETTYGQNSTQPSSTALYDTRFEQPLDTDFSSYRSFERVSSPEDCPSPLSAYDSPSDQGYLELSDTDSRALSIAFSATSLFGSTLPAPPPPVLQGEAFAYHGYNSDPCDTLASPVSELAVSPLSSSTSMMAGSYGIASPKDKIRSRCSQQLVTRSSSPVQMPSVSSLLSTTPTQSSPLKQQFSSFKSDGDQSDNGDDDGDDGGDDHDGEGTDEGRDMPKKKQRKRVRRDNESKPKAPRLILHCDYPNCTVACASSPSLARHRETHKWRGKYSPVRCAACRTPLSNEFSVQRHIMRSAETSRCRKMRVYNMMGSETLILHTLRFFPYRGHGKKTVRVDLEEMKERYL